jgi:hypothetical protein
VYLLPAGVALVGCAAAVMLLKTWHGELLWPDAEAGPALIPTDLGPPG